VKNHLRGRNLYSPDEIVARANEVKSVTAEFLDHRSSTRHFYTGWENVLNMYITNMPACYIDYYYFEFQDGFVTYPDNEATRVNLLRNGITAEDARTRLLQLVFGRQYTDPQQLDITLMDNLNMPRCEITTLSATKVVVVILQL